MKLKFARGERTRGVLGGYPTDPVDHLPPTTPTRHSPVERTGVGGRPDDGLLTRHSKDPPSPFLFWPRNVRGVAS